MAYNITAVLQEGPTIMDSDTNQVTLRRHAVSERQRDEIVNALNVLGAYKISVEQERN